MRIEIDTKNDSKKEILHALNILKAALGNEEVFSNEPEKTTQQEVSEQKTEGLFGAWNEPKEEESPPFSTFFDTPEVANTDNIKQEEEKSEENIDNQEETFYKEFKDDDDKKPRIKFY